MGDGQQVLGLHAEVVLDEQFVDLKDRARQRVLDGHHAVCGPPAPDRLEDLGEGLAGQCLRVVAEVTADGFFRICAVFPLKSDNALAHECVSLVVGSWLLDNVTFDPHPQPFPRKQGKGAKSGLKVPPCLRGGI